MVKAFLKFYFNTVNKCFFTRAFVNKNSWFFFPLILKWKRFRFPQFNLHIFVIVTDIETLWLFTQKKKLKQFVYIPNFISQVSETFKIEGSVRFCLDLKSWFDLMGRNMDGCIHYIEFIYKYIENWKFGFKKLWNWFCNKKREKKNGSMFIYSLLNFRKWFYFIFFII